MPQHVIEWQREHADFVRLLQLLEAQVQLFQGGQRPDYDLMLDVMHYMTRYADRFHHAREDLAFQRLARHQPAVTAIAAALNHQHAEMAADGAGLVAELRAVMQGAMLPRQAVASQACAYAACLRRHIEREERELYPLLAHLRQEDWFMIDSMIHCVDFGNESERVYRALHQQIAQAAGCGCDSGGG
ncbi:MAG TPA: hemerythrin domain-containing protein [Burkholderiaceae bacterium]|nr:hemerythrin domain-containing protein [Burkholderiaceae bacterium]